MSEPLPTVEEIEAASPDGDIGAWLRDHGYSALRNDECGCSVDSLGVWCGCVPRPDCHTA